MTVSSTRIRAMKRPFKAMRNALVDPLPRNNVLVFEGYEIDWPRVYINYRAREKSYRSEAFIDLPVEELSALNREQHHALFVLLGLSFATGHFLLSDFKKVHCACGKLPTHLEQLLGQQLRESLTEFRYLQGLDPSRVIEVTSDGAPLQPISYTPSTDSALMMNGGGKDSCVSAELLQAVGIPFTWFNAHPIETRFRVIDRSGVPDQVSVDFHIDPAVREGRRYNWGVKPYLFTVLSISLMVAYLRGHRYLITGSEQSADDPNLIYKGVEVNHQVGKTYSFECFFNTLVSEAVMENVLHFSIARPFTDLRLAEMFSHFPQYYDVFFSCNRGMGTDEWCNDCHKCAFIFLALYPFMEHQEMVKIFGEDIVQKPAMRQHMLELVTEGIKPWECVGSLGESRLALQYLLRKHPGLEDQNASPTWADMQAACSSLNEAEEYEHSMKCFHTAHSIPPAYVEALANRAQELLAITEQKWAINPPKV